MATSGHLKEITVGPVTFAPNCASQAQPDAGGDGDGDGGDADPDSAQKDVDKQALADASEALNTWADGLKSDAKTAAGYDTMTAEEQEAWDKEWTAA